MSLILASASPRRQELIRLVTEDFSIFPADIKEIPEKYQTPAQFALSMASAKARHVSNQFSDPVLGADTVVCLGARIFGKPVDAADNHRMLRELSGKWHAVITAAVLSIKGRTLGRVIVTTRVRFNELRDSEIAEYVGSSDGLDKAGGYGIQGAAGKYIAGIDGCYYNVVGLPLAAVADLIRAHI